MTITVPGSSRLKKEKIYIYEPTVVILCTLKEILEV